MRPCVKQTDPPPKTHLISFSLLPSLLLNLQRIEIFCHLRFWWLDYVCCDGRTFSECWEQKSKPYVTSDLSALDHTPFQAIELGSQLVCSLQILLPHQPPNFFCFLLINFIISQFYKHNLYILVPPQASPFFSSYHYQPFLLQSSPPPPFASLV